MVLIEVFVNCVIDIIMTSLTMNAASGVMAAVLF